MLMLPGLGFKKKAKAKQQNSIGPIGSIGLLEINFNFLRYLKYRCHFVVTFFTKTFKTNASQCNLRYSVKQQTEGEQ